MQPETNEQRIAREMREAQFAKEYAQQMIEHWIENRRTAYRRYYQLKDELKALELERNGQ